VRIGAVTLVVRDYAEAINWFTAKLGFSLIEDTDLGNGKRWVVVAPENGSGTALFLARATNDQQRAAIGNAAGGRVAFFLHSDDFYRDYAAMIANGVIFREMPRDEPYGWVAAFDDLYGNGWDLIGSPG